MHYIILISALFFYSNNLNASLIDEFKIKQKSDKALRMLELGNYDEAIKIYDEVLNINTNSAEIYHNMALALASKGQKNIALDAFEMSKKSINDKTKNNIKHSIYYNSGITAIETKNYQLAVDDLIEALYYDKKDDTSREALEYALKRLKKEQNKSGGDDNQDDDSEEESNNSEKKASVDNNEMDKEKIDKNDIERLLESLRGLRKNNPQKDEYYNGAQSEKDW